MNRSVQKTIIKPNQRFDKNFITAFICAVKNLFYLRELVYQLFRRDLFAVYKRSFAGYAWIIVTPLAGILSWVFLHKAHIIRPGDVGVPYPVYILLGTMIWGLFMGLLSSMMNAMDIYRFMLMKTAFPHEVIFGAEILIRLSQFALSFIIIIPVLFFLGAVNVRGVLLFPLAIIPLSICAVALGLLVSIMSVVSYDVKRIITGLIGLVMYITPVIYSVDVINNYWLKKLINLNPLTYLVCTARDILLYNRMYSLKGFALSSLMSVILLVVSWRIFYVSEDKIIERMI